jgi:hypothetical protein
MRRSLIQNVVTFAVMLGLFTSTIGCGSKVDGKYSGMLGMVTIEFKSGKATVTSKALGPTSTETDDYTVDGDTITVKTNTKDGNITFKIQKDGSLQEATMGTFTKVSG